MADWRQRVHFVDQRMEMRQPALMLLLHEYIPNTRFRLLPQTLEIQGQLSSIFGRHFVRFIVVR